MDGAAEWPMEEIVRAEPIRREVKAVVDRVNARLADFERIRKYHVLDREFSISTGELTPTMKIRRAHALRNHAETIGSLYQGRGPGVES
jgi:long-chain acyl-CoA synthetase